MKIIGICFTRSGMELARQMQCWFEAENAAAEQMHEEPVSTAADLNSEGGHGSLQEHLPDRSRYVTDWFCKGKLFRESVPEGFTYAEESMTEWAGRHFPDSDAMIFIGATGICVRAIAPFVKDKKTDPAVICFDEKGTFGISLLSGHIGGANALTEKLCRELGSIPVVTTATDVNRKFAVDVYATEHRLAIGSMELAKDVAAALVEGKNIPFSADVPIRSTGTLPGGITLCEDSVSSAYSPQEEPLKAQSKGICDETSASHSPQEEPASAGPAAVYGGEKSYGVLGIHVSPFTDRRPYEHTLQLIPRCITLGIGCRRDTPVEKIEALADRVLEEAHIHPEAVEAVATIDLKKDEKGLLEFCRRRNLLLTVYSAEELRAVEGDFSASSFVSGITGVDNVCERSAVRKSGGSLIVKKTRGDSSTCAAALKDWRIEI